MSFQSSLGEGVAEELADSQQEISIAEFFEKNKHMLGFDSGARGLVTAVKEAVDNALDAAEEAQIKPDIYVEIEEAGGYYRLTVEDNGPGITREQLPKVFGKLLYGSRFHVREQARGQQGIGISAAVLYGQLTSGKPAIVTSRTQGSADAELFELVIDTDENEPEIRTAKTTSWDRPHGTRIEIEMEANMRARAQLHDYIKHTAVVNPHARIELVEPNAEFKFERADGAELPAETEAIRPHPHGVELGSVLKMLRSTDSHSISGFLQEEFTRVGKKTADSIIDGFRDHHFGREMTWRPPTASDPARLDRVIQNAVSNKGADATAEFADRAGKRLSEYDRLAHGDVVSTIDVAADSIEGKHDVTFGDTVRENAVEAAWEAIRTKGEQNPEEPPLTDDAHVLVADATSTKKSETVVSGFAERLARQFSNAQDNRHRATRGELEAYVEQAAEDTEAYDDATIGETARENVVETVWAVMHRVSDDPPLVRELVDNRDATGDLLEGMREADILAPPTSCLAPITDSLVEAGLKKEFDAEFFAAATRDAEVHGGDPFIVEAGIAYGGELDEDGTVDVMRFANRVPLVYQRGACATTDVIKEIGWRNYGLDQPGSTGIPNGAGVIMIHVASTNVPFTSESKDAVANVPEIEDEIELAIREAARELKRFLKKRRSLEKRQKKQSVIATILPVMAEKLSEMTERDEPEYGDALARIMNNVLVQRTTRQNGDGTEITLTVENHTSGSAAPELTDIVTAEPTELSANAGIVEMDEEYFLTWNPYLGSGDSASLTYTLEGDASYDLSVEEVEDAKLTVLTD